MDSHLEPGVDGHLSGTTAFSSTKAHPLGTSSGHSSLLVTSEHPNISVCTRVPGREAGQGFAGKGEIQFYLCLRWQEGQQRQCPSGGESYTP